MRINKYLCANIISLIGNVGLFIFLLSTFGSFSIRGKAWLYIEENCGVWAFAILVFLLALPIDVLTNKFLHNKYTIKNQVNNEVIKYTYNILFWTGIISSVIYLLIYIWFITR